MCYTTKTELICVSLLSCYALVTAV